MISLKDVNEFITHVRELGEKVGAGIRKMQRDRLTALDVALERAIPSIEGFEKLVKNGSQAEIEGQSEKVAGTLHAVIEELKADGFDPSQLSTLEDEIRRARLWRDLLPANKDTYERLSPELIDNLTTMQAQVRKRLAELT